MGVGKMLTFAYMVGGWVKANAYIRGHSITTWTGEGGEGVSQMSMIVHAREGGGLVFSMWTFWGECTIFAPK